MLAQARAYIGSYLREVGVYADLLLNRSSGTTLLIFPSQGPEDGAANLRGYQIARYLRSRKWTTVVCPKHLRLRQRTRLIKLLKPDLILMQSARHPLNRPRLYQNVPIIFDIDDADYIADHSRAATIESIRESTTVIAGSRSVANFCKKHNKNVKVVWTGTPISKNFAPNQNSRRRVIAWAASNPLGSPSEAEFLLDVFSKLKNRNRNFIVRLYANDGSRKYNELVDRFSCLDIDVETYGLLSYDKFLKSLEDVRIGVAPLVDIEGFSGGKSFGKVLAYLDRGVPVLTHPVVDHPLFFKNGINGIMALNAEEWAREIHRLLEGDEERQYLAYNGRSDLQRRLSTEVSASIVENILNNTL